MTSPVSPVPSMVAIRSVPRPLVVRSPVVVRNPAAVRSLTVATHLVVATSPAWTSLAWTYLVVVTSQAPTSLTSLMSLVLSMVVVAPGAISIGRRRLAWASTAQMGDCCGRRR